LGGSEDETEVRAGESAGGAGREGYPAGDTAAFFGGGSPRERPCAFTDTESYFVSEASVYRLLKALDLIASPAYIVVNAPPRSTWR
jgi:hypothetical protein